jgi:hypothetical protein
MGVWATSRVLFTIRKTTMSIYQAIGYGLFAALSFYIPFNAYADRVIRNSKLANSTWPPLLISYVIWYIPIIIMLVGLVLFENIFICSGVVFVAVLWAYIGHKRIQKLSVER